VILHRVAPGRPAAHHPGVGRLEGCPVCLGIALQVSHPVRQGVLPPGGLVVGRQDVCLEALYLVGRVFVLRHCCHQTAAWIASRPGNRHRGPGRPVAGVEQARTRVRRRAAANAGRPAPHPPDPPGGGHQPDALGAPGLDSLPASWRRDSAAITASPVPAPRRLYWSQALQGGLVSQVDSFPCFYSRLLPMLKDRGITDTS